MEIQNKEGYTISTSIVKLNIATIHTYLSANSYWAKNIPFDTVKRAIEHSLCFGVYHYNQQVGFARLITDTTTFAYLCDVFILPEHRGKGLAKWLMSTIHTHPDLQGLRRWMLATRDAHTLYEQFGWTAITDTKKFMQFHQPDIYNQL